MVDSNPKCLAIREEFSALLDGELTPAERERVEDHLSTCAECLRALNRLKQVDDTYARLKSVPAPAGFEGQVSNRLEPRRVVRFPIRRLAGAMLAAAGIALVLTVWPRTVEAPRDAAVQLSKAMDESGARSAPARAEAPVQARGQEEPDSVPEPALEVSGYATPETADQTSREIAPAPMAEDSRQRSGLSDEISAQRVGGVSGGADQSAAATGGEISSESDDMDAPRPQIPASEMETLDRASASRRGSEDLEEADKEMVQPRAAPAETRPALAFESAAGAAQETVQTIEGANSALESRTDGQPRNIQDIERSSAPAAAKSKTEAKADARDAAAPRTFDIRDGVWYETGYAGQQVTELDRAGALLAGLAGRDAQIAELRANQSRIVFASGGVWYALPAVK